MQLLIPNTLQLPIFIMLSFYEVGLNIITALSSMTLQSPKMILKCSSFRQQMMEQVGLIMHPSPNITLPTIQLSPRFSTFGFLIIKLKLKQQKVNLFHFSQRQLKLLTSKEMDYNRVFVNICPPTQDQYSPRRPDQLSRGANLKLYNHSAQLIELKIGNYNVRAQRVTNNQTIDGYAALYDRNSYKLIFEGEFVRSKRNGFGLEYDTNGTLVFQGYFRDDKYDGWGHSDVYTGQYKEGVYDGYGVLSTSNVYYEGYFHRGQFSGEGVYFNGSEMVPFYPIKNVNSFLSQGLKNNLQIMNKFKIEQIYIGEWKQGTKHGFGRLWKKDYWYSGQFSNDLPHGLGAEEDKKTNKVTQTKYKLGVKIN